MGVKCCTPAQQEDRPKLERPSADSQGQEEEEDCTIPIEVHSAFSPTNSRIKPSSSPSGPTL